MRNEAIFELQKEGFKLEIFQDEDSQSPDEWGNTDAFLVYDHRQFSVERKGYDPEEIFQSFQTKNTYEGYHVFPLFAYIHSGVSLSLGRSEYPFNDRWDTSYRGFVLVKKQKGWSFRRDTARKVAEGIVSEWNMYLSGDVYGYQITDKDDNHVDSCWGYYGLDYAKQEAISVLDAEVNAARKSHFNQLKAWIKQGVNILHRKPLFA